MNYFVIDVREPDEFATGHVNGSINITARQILSQDNKLQNLPKDTNILVYCRTGNRANTAKVILQQLGFSNVTNGINQANIEANYDL